ncbi:hypothetical protein HPB50_008311 [Hyalomma asiaticum]|uniref:Uncharacterized protein n=1 Tax=Hyalomma asiaticum TaxID=266040 RepID=A0ACB7SWH5_HYAAI|nr:hypothetical protein HPB50_008311 [Hyalomma asiaticum]
MPALQLVDSLYAWFIAIMCFWIQIWAAIVFRSSGVLLVGLVSAFRISREEAAWPFEICSSINSAQGFLVGVLVRYWDTRTLNAGATLLAAVGAIACFIWDTPAAYIISIGLCFGAGTGIMVPTNVVALHRYFDKYRTSASGVSFAGASLSSMVLPPLIGRLLDTYGLQGTMLIVGALVLNAMPGSIAIRSTPTFPRPPHQPMLSTTTTVARCSSSSSEQSDSQNRDSENRNLVNDFFSTDILLWESGVVVSTLPPPSSGRSRRRRRGVSSMPNLVCEAC